MVKKTMAIMLSRFHLIPERYGQTDGRTDRRRTNRIAISISRVSVLTRDKNGNAKMKIKINKSLELLFTVIT